MDLHTYSIASPLCITVRGELGPKAKWLLDTLADEVILFLSGGPPADGIPPMRRRHEVHNQILTEIQILNAKGLGRILAAAADNALLGH